jgi:hypothetical protein
MEREVKIEMMEKIRVWIMQYTTIGVVLILTILFCRKVIIDANLVTKFYSLQIDGIFITLLLGLFLIALLVLNFSAWIMKEPKVMNHGKERPKKVEKIDMGKVKNVEKYQ